MIIHAGVRFHYGHYFGQDCGARRGRAGGNKMGTVAEQRQYERNFINLKRKYTTERPAAPSYHSAQYVVPDCTLPPVANPKAIYSFGTCWMHISLRYSVGTTHMQHAPETIPVVVRSYSGPSSTLDH